MDVLVTYDVSTLDAAGQRRLARVAAICERYGVRSQYSVFECRLSEASLQRLIGELLDAIEVSEDSIFIYRFDRPLPETRISLGYARGSRLGDPWIIAGPRDTDAP